jgi:cell wall-associated NlpC family hydrolase
VLFRIGRDVSHVGIYVGDGRFVHAPSSGGTVRMDPLDAAYWRERFAGGRRVAR